MLHSCKATPHKTCAEYAPTDFSSDCIEISQAYWRMSRNFCARWRKICKQIQCKAVRRALCGVALNYSVTDSNIWNYSIKPQFYGIFRPYPPPVSINRQCHFSSATEEQRFLSDTALFSCEKARICVFHKLFTSITIFLLFFSDGYVIILS